MIRRDIELRVRRLSDAPDPGLGAPSTPQQQLALVDTLTREAWALAGAPRPSYARADAPVRLRALRVQPRTAAP